MFPYQKEADEKYFNGYGVKLGSNENSKNSYVNSILQILINLDRKLSYECCSYSIPPHTPGKGGI